MDLSDRWWRLSNLYVIRDKDRRRRRLVLSPSQERIKAAVKPRLDAGLPIRHQDLKARQVMVSTFWALFYLDDTVFRPNTTTFVTAQRHETLGLLWDTIRLAYESMPDLLRPKTRQESARSLFFEGTNSKISVSLKVEGATAHNVHVSEYALCDPEDIEKTLAACPRDANITLESVAEGLNHAYDKWNDARDGYTKLFHPWFLQREYRLDVPLAGPRTQDEERLAGMALRQYGFQVTDAQLAWRRQRKRDLKRLFPALCAEDDSSCFLASGGAWFDAAKVKVLIREAEEHLARNPPIKDDGETAVWEAPQPRHVYVAGADVAGGKESSSEDPDYSVLAILCLTCRRTAARYRARCNHDSFYRTCHRMGVEYNRALLAPERNGIGAAIILGLREGGYPNLFTERPKGTRANLNRTLSEPKVGWETTADSKPVIMAGIKQALEGESEDDEERFEPEFLWLDTEFLRETLNVRREGGKIGAMTGHDDLVMAYAIAREMAHRQRSMSPADLGRIAVGAKRESA